MKYCEYAPSWSVIDDSRVTLQIVYDRNVFIVQGAGPLNFALVTPILTTIFFATFGLTTLVRVMIFPVLSVVIIYLSYQIVLIK
jgi:hypothetical protein